MKAISNFLIVGLFLILNTSCLKSGLDELETYDLNDITNVRFEYRWWDESAEQLRVMEMLVEKTIDTTTKEINCTIVVPESTTVFTDEIRSEVSLSTLAINVDISTAARVAPVGNAPAMGVFPSDFSAKEFTYTVTAGNGDEVDWIIRIADFSK